VRARPVAGVVAGAVALRLWLLSTSAARLQADEAVTGIAARAILDGDHRAFYPGQAYMGSAEQYLQAGVLAVLPDTALTLRLPQVALAGLACVLVHRLAVRCGLSPRRALVAAAIFAAGPYFAVLWSAQANGAYDAGLLAGLAGILVAVGTEPDDPHLTRRLVLFGVCCGLGAWSNVQSAYLLLPAGWWVLATVRGRTLRGVATITAGFAIGAVPALGHVVLTGPLEFDRVYEASSFAQRAEHLLADSIPQFLGAQLGREPFAAWLPPALVTMVALAALGAAVVARAGGIGRIVRLRRDERAPLDLLLLAVVAAPVLFVQTNAAMDDARYLFMLYGIVPILLAAAPGPRGWLQRRDDRLIAGVLVVLAVAANTALSAQRAIDDDSGGGVVRSGQQVRIEDLDEVVDALVAAGARTAYADYWLAQVLRWEADDEVIVEALYTKRFPDATEAVEADPSPALVVAGSEAAAVRDGLAALGASFDEQVVAGWAVFTSIDPGVHPEFTLHLADELRRLAG
jgi:hypothetical protein